MATVDPRPRHNRAHTTPSNDHPHQSSRRKAGTALVARRRRPARHRVLHDAARSVGAGAARRLRHLGASRLVVRAPHSTSSTSSRSRRRSATIAGRRGSTARCFSASTRTRCRSRRAPARSRCWPPTASRRMLATDDEYTPTPAISHAILTYNRGRTSAARPTASSSRRRTTRPTTAASSTTRRTAARPTPAITGWIEAAANAYLEQSMRGVKRIDHTRGAGRDDHPSARFPRPYVADLGNVIDFEAIRGGEASAWASIRWAAPACTTGPGSPSTTGSTSRWSATWSTRPSAS